MSSKEDPLAHLSNYQACPSCACLMEINSKLCPECGAFLSKEILEYEPEIDVVHSTNTKEKKILDPTHYSLNPAAQIPVDNEEDEEIEDMTKEWMGGSSDFKFEEE